MEDILYKFLALFNRLPQPVKQLVGKIYSIIPAKLKYGSFYYDYLRRLHFIDRIEHTEEVNRKQQELLFEQVNRSIESIPFYKKYEKIHTIEQFQELPVINKNTIIERHDEFLNPSLSGKNIKVNTGGSSGTPLEFYIEKGVSRPKEKAHFDWFWGQFGYKHGDKMLMIRGMPIPGNRLYEYRTIDNILNVSCYQLNESNISNVAERINSFSPKFIHAYPSSLKIAVSLIESCNIKMHFKIKAVFLGSEYLSKSDRRYFENFFNARIVNWYGHTEKLIHGGNCLYSNEYHFYPAYGYLELLDEHNNIITQPGKEGKIVATGFDNSVMPFIRYDTGDLGVLSENHSCKCGFKGISLSTITGREHEIIFLSDGTQVSLTAFIFGQHLDAFNKIREMQVLQDSIGRIELRIVKNSNFTRDDEDSIKKVLLKSVSNKLVIDIVYVDFVPKTTRGKNIFFVSNI